MAKIPIIPKTCKHPSDTRNPCRNIRRTKLNNGRGLVPAAPRRLDELFNLAAGEVLPVPVMVCRRGGVPFFSR